MANDLNFDSFDVPLKTLKELEIGDELERHNESYIVIDFSKEKKIVYLQRTDEEYEDTRLIPRIIEKLEEERFEMKRPKQFLEDIDLTIEEVSVMIGKNVTIIPTPTL